MNTSDLPRERAIVVFLVALSLLSYARLYMLRDAYADDNCWLLAMFIGDSLADFLATGWTELRRVPQGVFYYFYMMPYLYLENPYAIWHTVSIAVFIGTVLVLYRFVRGRCNDPWLAVFVAATLIVVPLDHVVPYVASLNYRLGTFLGLASLYLTDTAARDGRWGWKMPAAILCAAVAQHVLTESALGLEPARALLLLTHFHRQARPMRETIVPLVKWLTPFALVGVALVAYKLLFKPYGIYAGMYSTGFSHFFDRDAVNEAYRLFALGLWRLLRRQSDYAQTASIVLGVVAFVVVLLFLVRFRTPPSGKPTIMRSPHLFLVVFGAAIIVPTMFIFFFGGRPPRLGTDSNHSTIMQPGYALMVGATLHWLATRLYSRRRAYYLPLAGLLAALAGTGTYFTNLNHDMFKVASTRQQEFWSEFKQRFPTPPKETTFIVDAVPPRYSPRLESFFQFEDIHASYELELVFNRLYEPGRLRGTRRYHAYGIEQIQAEYREKGPRMFRETIGRTGHYGIDTLDFSKAVYVYWRGGKVLVNEEILKENPKAIYSEMANKRVPEWAAPLPN